ncbi:2-oxoglutarate oxidoreductase subunit KorA [Sporomusa ovata DSM 2662]|uniref:2-oxoglutarate oxidoreductase, alpha subunit n=1 Tax=Sporomusa ovata TaxID=2378 RepID=A0A0U1KWQ5_9FIRM|nr:3-methyl-2-oxobutanoate dehydrogenase subunit VorB [Sporomusa ovata]EQB28727.1 ketoisovalerate oxidoreductase subunit VorB [Sporomusa ovata DSM 2662]CQR71878.1 2-oxoglutarate oxidoreductase, alpha subunit [Sporomusa ovata]
MSEKVLMKGNEAIAEAAVVAGCRHYFGYPITPQTEIPEYMSKRMPQVGGVFLQAESEIAAINMVYGAAGAGARVMTSSSSPGISLKQEGISYIAGAELPCLIVNIMRGGPGLGGIQPAQSDYFQATKGGGHGDYHTIVLAPNSVQEMADFTMLGFSLADQYRNPVMLLGDGVIGQMMEPVEIKENNTKPVEKPWAAVGMHGRTKPNIISSLYLKAKELEEHNNRLQKKYALIRENEMRWEEIYTKDAELILVAYGITARIAQSAVDKARENGKKVGLLRPISLWPFPEPPFSRLAETAKAFLTLELSAGQMIEDVRLATHDAKPVYFYGRTGGMIMTPTEIYREVTRILDGKEGK